MRDRVIKYSLLKAMRPSGELVACYGSTTTEREHGETYFCVSLLLASYGSYNSRAANWLKLSHGYWLGIWPSVDKQLEASRC